ncbi:hypothetical protein V8G54_000523 [Vigna mungo]|uniref:Uncharacterized protein n=1 Tax=Vigna mungo TaxID=3915 RepID=A0AAQ3SAW8_VIGMU
MSSHKRHVKLSTRGVAPPWRNRLSGTSIRHTIPCSVMIRSSRSSKWSTSVTSIMSTPHSSLWTKLPLTEIWMHIKIKVIPKTHSSNLTVSTVIETLIPVEISPVVEGLPSSSKPPPSSRDCD